ncbi:MAG: 16S rRNA (cytosine(1402)-N(4))-methyltransferase RsmH, partial [Actinomycetota bacterium]|nr:16S rRNA (cytosine(1402)-N(4))-methyltransferase RsmH [Actinomycetota bacterium]
MPRTHVPVLAGELIEALDPQPGQVAVDCTLGGGGHARLVAGRLGPAGLLVGIDRDPLAEEAFAELAAEVACRTRFVRADFATGLRTLGEEGLLADHVYLDLGMSSMQVDTRERGFSYAYDAPLDMRMDPAQELTAAAVVNTWERRRLARALREYGEERYADRIAGEIVRRRESAEIDTTFELVDAITAAIPTPARFAGGHPAKRTFQAIRIAVNEELEQLDAALPLAWELLRPSGRLAAIAFHSLEDRRVKRFLADRARGCI